MKLIAEKLIEIIIEESSKISDDKKSQEFEKLLAEMKGKGLIRKPSYDFPMVDTIGKRYYSSINKRK